MKKIKILIIIFVAICFFAYLWWLHGTSPVNASDTTQKTFVVQHGEPLRQIANRLASENLINDPIVFFLVAKANELDNKIEAGDFHLSPNMSALDIAKTMTKGTMDVWITVPEGYRAAEIADVLKQKFPQYTPTWQTDLQQNEGYLFPDTYLLPKNTTIDQIIKQMRDNFTTKYDGILPKNTQSYTQEQILTVASLVEREAKFPEDRPLVASVIYNRLQNAMPLQIDATIQYALGYQTDEKTWWKKNVTAADLQLNSPYNTYKQVGLPPAPIANPGLPSLEAAVNPAKTDYLFYVSDKSGHNHYETTLDQHNADILKYSVQ